MGNPGIDSIVQSWVMSSLQNLQVMGRLSSRASRRLSFISDSLLDNEGFYFEDESFSAIVTGIIEPYLVFLVLTAFVDNEGEWVIEPLLCFLFADITEYFSHGFSFRSTRRSRSGCGEFGEICR